jgi:hypothetical protein
VRTRNCDTCGSVVDRAGAGERLANCQECGAPVVFPEPEPLPVIQPEPEPGPATKKEPATMSAPVCVHCGSAMHRTRRTKHTPLNALALFFVGMCAIVFSFSGCLMPVLLPLGAIMVILSPFRMREREIVMGCSCGHFYQLLR